MTSLRFQFPVRKRRATGPSMERVSASRVARMLALAHYVERLVEAGELESYATAARALGLTRARLAQVMKLVLLAPKIQERILLGDNLQTSERSLRAVVAEPEWRKQHAIREKN